MYKKRYKDKTLIKSMREIPPHIKVAWPSGLRRWT